MKFIKLGHSCVLIEDGQNKILIDPGIYSSVQNIEPDIILITHVHTDHIDLQNNLQLLQRCSNIITNTEVSAELKKHNIDAVVVEDGQSINVVGFEIKGIGRDHAIIHSQLPKFMNTGYMINNKIFHPGDALTVPENTNLEVLLLPIVAPWSKISETLDYMDMVKAKTFIPIHDGFLNDGGAFYRFAKMWAEKNNSKLLEVKNFQTYEL